MKQLNPNNIDKNFGVYKDIKKNTTKEFINEETGEIEKFYLVDRTSKSYSFYNDLMTFDEYDDCRLYDNRNYKRRKRVSHKMLDLDKEKLLSDKNLKRVFITLTLNDDTLKLKEETIKKKINKYLKNQCEHGIVNYDYGKVNERLHFHAICLTDKNLIPVINKKGNQTKSKKGQLIFNFEYDDYNLGFLPQVEIIDSNDKVKVKNYLAKVSNHAIKKSTKNRRIFYF